MRKLLMMAAALATGALFLNGASAQAASTQQPTANEITGTVTAVNQDKQQITVNGQTYRIEMGGGAAMWPQVGDQVTLYYKGNGARKTVTRIGQAQNGATSQSAANQRMAAQEGNKVTGTVTEADRDKQQIKIGGQTFTMKMGGGAAVMPSVGDKVTLYYEDNNGQKTVTRIGQAQ